MTDIRDTALIFEGGGMRGAYSAGVVRALLENDLNFGWVGGISAGSSNLVNYVSRDVARAKAAFTEFAADPMMGNVRTFLKGQGYFNSHYIYQQSARPGAVMPLDSEAFFSNPCDIAIGGFDVHAGQTVYWTREDIKNLDDLMIRVQASSTLPGFMPLVHMDGTTWADGALGSSGGIAIDAAKAAGFEKFFVVLSRTRDYWKPAVRRPRFIRAHFRKYPLLAQAIIDRPGNYNATKQELLDLEKSGQAYLFVPEQMNISINERSVPKLTQAFHDGLDQARREVPAWKEFLTT